MLTEQLTSVSLINQWGNYFTFSLGKIRMNKNKKWTGFFFFKLIQQVFNVFFFFVK